MRPLLALLLLSCLWTACEVWDPNDAGPSRIRPKPKDPPHGNSLSNDDLSREKVILAYQIQRRPEDKLETISRRFRIALPILEKFNGVETESQMRPFVYVPLLREKPVPFAPLQFRLVKLARDSYMRPIFRGDWIAPETAKFTSLTDWLTPDDDKRFLFPVEGYISSRFAWRWNRLHKGIDIAARIGSPIVAAREGVVAYRGWKEGFGLLVVIQHDEGQTYYAHCKSAPVQTGQWVRRGETIASVGNSGHSFGAHLHFEYRDVDNRSVDPSPYMTPNCRRTLEADNSSGFFSSAFSAKALPATCLSREI